MSTILSAIKTITRSLRISPVSKNLVQEFRIIHHSKDFPISIGTIILTLIVIQSQSAKAKTNFSSCLNKIEQSCEENEGWGFSINEKLACQWPKLVKEIENTKIQLAAGRELNGKEEDIKRFAPLPLTIIDYMTNGRTQQIKHLTNVLRFLELSEALTAVSNAVIEVFDNRFWQVLLADGPQAKLKATIRAYQADIQSLTTLGGAIRNGELGITSSSDIGCLFAQADLQEKINESIETLKKYRPLLKEVRLFQIASGTFEPGSFQLFSEGKEIKDTEFNLRMTQSILHETNPLPHPILLKLSKTDFSDLSNDTDDCRLLILGVSSLPESELTRWRLRCEKAMAQSQNTFIGLTQAFAVASDTEKLRHIVNMQRYSILRASLSTYSFTTADDYFKRYYTIALFVDLEKIKSRGQKNPECSSELTNSILKLLSGAN